MKGIDAQEIERANLHPLNEISKGWLERAGIRPNPRHLHALSLVRWALEEHAIQVDTSHDPSIAGKAEAALRGMTTKWQPDSVMKFLTAAEHGAATITPDDLQQAGSPVDAAQMLLGCLTSAIAARR